MWRMWVSTLFFKLIAVRIVSGSGTTPRRKMTEPVTYVLYFCSCAATAMPRVTELRVKWSW